MSTIKIYNIYPQGASFTAQSIDYPGTKLTIAATSIRQAYAVAHKDKWINPTDSHPVGIISIYRRGDGTTLWCGCSGHNVTGGRVKHGAGITALRTAISDHQCPRSLRHRLLAAANQQARS
jgi:hypothetical protein